MVTQVPFYRHSLDQSYATGVARVLDTPFLTSGSVCREVEKQLYLADLETLLELLKVEHAGVF